MANCLICRQTLLAENTLSIGELVACNQFEIIFDSRASKYQLSISECAACNLVQLSQYPTKDFVIPRLSWIRYNEPSSHLDIVAEYIMTILPIGKTHVATSSSPFDSPLLERLAKYGVAHKQLGLTSLLPQEPGKYPYLESIQALLRPELLSELAIKRGAADIVLCRYLLEHSHDPLASLRGFAHLMNKDGLLLIEIPDSSKFLESMDYSFIWEEHICYFTEDTFRFCAHKAGYEVVHFFRFTGVLEDALIFVLKVRKSFIESACFDKTLERTDIFSRYKAGFEITRYSYQNALKKISEQGKKVAIFGAAHQSIMFINAFNISEQISCAIDDASEKIGYLIPGTNIPIVTHEQLAIDPAIEICLLGVGPNVEEKIREKCGNFLSRGGKMYSIFPGSGGDTINDFAD